MTIRFRRSSHRGRGPERNLGASASPAYRILALGLLLAGTGCASGSARAVSTEVVPGPTGERRVLLPLAENSLRLAVIGDTGTGSAAQYEVGRMLSSWREKFPFEMALLLGDNMYGADTPQDFKKKFEEPYKALLDAGVKFYAALGNHDNPSQRFYKLFNMGGEKYYSVKAPKGAVRLFAIDSNYLDKPQLEWLEKELSGAGKDWKVCFFHHPLYSSGLHHGPSVEKREVLEPLFVKHGVNVVFTGHEHFYERIKPQKGVHYFISGSAGKLRKANIGKTGITDRGFDEDYHFLLVEFAGDEMHFQAISRTGTTIDSGVIRRVAVD